MSAFGEFLYTLRKEKGMTQAELAAALGVTNKAVSKWETGEAMPETSLLLPLSRILGVTVDELLEGKRASSEETANETASETVNKEKTDETQNREARDKIEFDLGDIRGHIFTRGKDDEIRAHICTKNKSLTDVISGAICGTVFMLGILAYLIVGSVLDLWHPYWIIIPVCALLCGIIGAICDFANKEKRKLKAAHGENPVIGMICACVMLSCIIAFLLASTFTGLWHPLWIIVVVGAVFCAITGTVGKILTFKKQS